MAKKKRKAHNRGHVHVDAHYRKKPGAQTLPIRHVKGSSRGSYKRNIPRDYKTKKKKKKQLVL